MDEISKALLEHGAIGILALVEMVAIIVLWRKLEVCQEARLNEAKELVKVTEGVRDAMEGMTAAMAPRRAP